VLWLGLEANGALESLAADLRRTLRAEGQPLDRKPFTAHLTLARFRGSADIGPLGDAPAPCMFTASELLLIRSHLLSKGSRYERLQALPLEG